MGSILLAIPLLFLVQGPRERKAVFPEGLDSEIIHSKRLKSGLPLGGIGCGVFELMSDGSIGNLTINNNRDQPIESAPGCFAAFWTKSNGASVLQLSSPFG